MNREAPPNDRLDGWEQISAYLGWHTRTLIRWEKQKGMPIHRVPGGKRQAVFAYRHEIDQWYHQRGKEALNEEAAVSHDGSSRALSVSPVAVLESSPSFEDHHSEEADLVAAPSNGRPLPHRTYRAAILVAVALLGAIAAWRMSRPQHVEINSITQLTDDGTAKQGLLTDGTHLYFSEVVGSRELLSEMDEDGGPIKRIDLPLHNFRPESISPDGNFLLIAALDGFEEEHALWIVPVHGGKSRQVNGVRCNSAAWFPDGKSIVYSQAESLNQVSLDGTSMRRLISVPGTPIMIHWSRDGRHLRFLLDTPSQSNDPMVEIDYRGALASSDTEKYRVLAYNCCKALAYRPDSESYFGIGEQPNTNHLFFWHPNRLNFSRLMVKTEVGTRFKAASWVAADSRRLFVMNSTSLQGDLVRVDPATGNIAPFLSGMDARDVDFAKRDGLIVFLGPKDDSLWVSDESGHNARRLSPPGMDIELPRWSPDSKRIAFMGKLPDHPWRIYIVSALGGPIKEASSGNDGQGAPTWSPDGNTLSYGGVQCQQEHTCAIHTIDLATGNVETLPRSQGLGTARWSPDGRYIAALDPDSRQLMLFDMKQHNWTKLADGANGNDLSWSADSRYLFTNSIHDNGTLIMRVPLDSRVPKTVIDLSSVTQMAGHIDTWFALTPDGSLLVKRWLNVSEIYSLNYTVN